MNLTPTLLPVVAHNPWVELDPVTSADSREPDCSDLLLSVHHHLDGSVVVAGENWDRYVPSENEILYKLGSKVFQFKNLVTCSLQHHHFHHWQSYSVWVSGLCRPPPARWWRRCRRSLSAQSSSSSHLSRTGCWLTLVLLTTAESAPETVWKNI